MSTALAFRDVRKRFDSTIALAGMTFEVPRGTITGLVGPNGAGKTTCFSVAAGLLKADAGAIDVLGAGAFDPARSSGKLGLLPQDALLPAGTRVRDELVYCCRLQGMSPAQAERESDRLLDVVELRERARSRIGDLSHGMKRRVGVAQALLGSPELILLDEPTNGLDPHLVAQMRDTLREQRQRHGSTLVVSSHVLGELELLCDHVIFVEAGQVTTSGSMRQVTGQDTTARVLLAAPVSLELLQAKLSGTRCSFEESWLRVVAPGSTDAVQLNRRVLSALLELDAGIIEVRTGDSLEDTYLARRNQARL
jgi:ABC-type multidrug transport system ATPase subunit